VRKTKRTTFFLHLFSLLSLSLPLSFWERWCVSHALLLRRETVWENWERERVKKERVNWVRERLNRKSNFDRERGRESEIKSMEVQDGCQCVCTDGLPKERKHVYDVSSSFIHGKR
jgi:hypothetical protein